MNKTRFLAAATLALIVSSALGPNRAKASGSGGGGGGNPAPGGCTGGATITQFDNAPGYGKYSPYVGGIRSTLTVQNCTSSTATWTATMTYSGGWQTQFACKLPATIGAGLSGTCRVDDSYLSLNTTYQVTARVMDSAGVILASATGSATTPATPNPNPGA